MSSLYIHDAKAKVAVTGGASGPIGMLVDVTGAEGKGETAAPRTVETPPA
jgi:hypothetical protein